MGGATSLVLMSTMQNLWNGYFNRQLAYDLSDLKDEDSSAQP